MYSGLFQEYSCEMNENKRLIHLISADLTSAKFTNFILITKITSQYSTRGKSRHFIILILKVRMTDAIQSTICIIQFWTIQIFRFFCFLFFFSMSHFSLPFHNGIFVFWGRFLSFRGPFIFWVSTFLRRSSFLLARLFLFSGYFSFFLSVTRFWGVPSYLLIVSLSLGEFLFIFRASFFFFF